jgi:hypothetical protein
MLTSLLTVAIYFSASSTLNLDSSDRNAKSLNIGDYVLYTTAILTNQGNTIPLYCSLSGLLTFFNNFAQLF